MLWAFGTEELSRPGLYIQVLVCLYYVNSPPAFHSSLGLCRRYAVRTVSATIPNPKPHSEGCLM